MAAALGLGVRGEGRDPPGAATAHHRTGPCDLTRRMRMRFSPRVDARGLVQRSRTRTTFSSGEDRMSFSQKRDVTHRSPENSRVWSLKYGEFGFDDWEYVSSVRATGQPPPSQPTAWT
ncbi:hypothetical protein SHIRM173S_05558 [Streptomyces hirsutus]